jgi:3-hydroxyisobutyrate dehydrogenase
MVRDDEASRRVWLNPVDGALIGMWPGTLALECSTLTPAWVLELAAAVSARDVAFLDAPVAGSRPQAEAGALVFMVGGGAVDVERAGPLLEAMGAAVHHAWATGSGALVKLGVNAMLGIQVAALAEVLGLMRVGGVDPARAVEILGATPVMSPATGAAAASMLARRFAPLFPVELVEKDNSYVSAAAESLGGATPLAGAAREVMRQAIAESYGDENLTGNVRLYDRQNASTADLGRP